MRTAPGAIVHVGRSAPGQGSERFTGVLSTTTRRNVRTTKAWGITTEIPRGQDIDPAMPALRLAAPWRQASDATPAASPSAGTALPGGIATTTRKGR